MKLLKALKVSGLVLIFTYVGTSLAVALDDPAAMLDKNKTQAKVAANSATLKPEENVKPTISTMGKNPGMQRPKIEDLGQGKYQIGNIVVDKLNRQFEVSGKMLKGDAPLEFLLISKNGPKAYESLVEVDANAFEFNLACILIGLQDDNIVQSGRDFDPNPLVGNPVEIYIGWQDGKVNQRLKIEKLLLNSGKADVTGEWTYIGSGFSSGGFYMADVDGVLVGLMHTAASIIDHKSGLGVSNYGAVGANKHLMPSEKSTINILVAAQ